MLVTADFYINAWGGQWDGTESELEKLIDLSEHVVDNAIMGRISTITDYPESIQYDVKKAVCSQIDYVIANGGMDCFTSDEFSSVSLGNFSYSTGGNSSSSTNGSADTLCSAAGTYLRMTGLMYRGL